MPMTETNMEPRQPSLLEKKANIQFKFGFQRSNELLDVTNPATQVISVAGTKAVSPRAAMIIFTISRKIGPPGRAASFHLWRQAAQHFIL